jgi:TetR/AcrR family transcriptional regulator
MRELLTTHVAPWLGVIVVSIEKAQADGSMRRDVDPQAYVLQVIHLVVGTFTTGITLQTLLGNGSKRRGTTADRRLIDELKRMARLAVMSHGYDYRRK